jgi:protein-S-isoprenylcysteine O-methyltransferase Ste14
MIKNKRGYVLNFFITLCTLIFWPIIPTFWIITHKCKNFVKRLKLFVYPLSFIVYLPQALLIYKLKDLILSISFPFQRSLNYIGFILFVIGIILHIWTFILLGFDNITGKNEILKEKYHLIYNGPFAFIRHPTYFAHTLIFLGLFLFTGFLALLILTIIDFLLVVIIIIPLEEKELIDRYGDEYRIYINKVKWKILPYIL